ncbi:hypothetical protein VPHZ6_orf00055 [Vibrio phage VPHZ6]|nr:hypothetical protein VPHZ6_orf00055 [Vibrio phage VPHZ6]
MNTTKSESAFDVKSVGRRFKKTHKKLLLICLVSLTACQSAPSQSSKAAVCDPTPPRLQWTKDSNGGIYLPPESAAELVNFIYDLKECANQ